MRAHCTDPLYNLMACGSSTPSSHFNVPRFIFFFFGFKNNLDLALGGFDITFFCQRDNYALFLGHNFRV